MKTGWGQGTNIGHTFSLPRDRTSACAETSDYIVEHRLQAWKIFTVDTTLHVTESSCEQPRYLSLQHLLLSWSNKRKNCHCPCHDGIRK